MSSQDIIWKKKTIRATKNYQTTEEWLRTCHKWLEHSDAAFKPIEALRKMGALIYQFDLYLIITFADVNFKTEADTNLIYIIVYDVRMTWSCLR